ncbi:MAG: hypothetical protein H6605_02370 [Flavobacteriales bacterium]|nr:hypothetical protein [Flavobacteriales bacterium]
MKHIEDDIWKKYSEGSLSKNELERIEMHIVDCEICRDMKEGLDALIVPGELNQFLKNLEEKIDKQIHKQTSRPLWVYYSAAAGILALAVAFSWLIFKTDSSGLVIKDRTISLPSDTLRIDRLKKEPELKKDTSETQFTINDNPVRSEAIKNLDETRISRQNSYATDSSIMEMKSRNLTGMASDLAINDEVAETSVQKTLRKESVDETDGEVKKSTQIEVTTDTYKNVWPMNTYNQKMMNRGYTNSYDTTFISKARVFYNKNQYDSSLSYLNSYGGFQGLILEEELLYLKALNLIKQHKKQEAESVLKDVIKYNGVRKEAAERILKTF